MTIVEDVGFGAVGDVMPAGTANPAAAANLPPQPSEQPAEEDQSLTYPWYLTTPFLLGVAALAVGTVAFFYRRGTAPLSGLGMSRKSKERRAAKRLAAKASTAASIEARADMEMAKLDAEGVPLDEQARRLVRAAQYHAAERLRGTPDPVVLQNVIRIVRGEEPIPSREPAAPPPRRGGRWRK